MDGTMQDGNLGGMGRMSKNNSVTPSGANRTLMGLGLYNQRSDFTPNNQTAIGSGNRRGIFGQSGMGNRGNDKTGAPVDYYMAAEGE